MDTNLESNSRKVSAIYREPKRRSTIKRMKRTWELYLFVLPALASLFIFHYIPIYGIQIAFKDFMPHKGIWGSEWIGFYHFKRFFNSYYFGELIRNTVAISLYSLVVGFPLPIILALGLNELNDGFFKKFVQTTTYAPYFISTVVMCGMVISFLSPTTGIINKARVFLGKEPIAYLMEAKRFRSIYVLSGVWQGTGWGSIIYLATLAGVDPQLHEAAIIDGATKLQRIWHINLPSLVPTMVILLILNAGGILSVGHEKVLLLQNPLNIDTSEVISTYVYKSGLLNAQYGFSTAVGLFNSVINFILLVFVNRIAKKFGETSIW